MRRNFVKTQMYRQKLLKKMSGDFMENLFSKFQYGFGKGYSTQQCLIA